jgi:hypothetical protein
MATATIRSLLEHLVLDLLSLALDVLEALLRLLPLLKQPLLATEPVSRQPVFPAAAGVCPTPTAPLPSARVGGSTASQDSLVVIHKPVSLDDLRGHVDGVAAEEEVVLGRDGQGVAGEGRAVDGESTRHGTRDPARRIIRLAIVP